MPVKYKLPENSPANLLIISMVDQHGSSEPGGNKICIFASELFFTRDTCENGNYGVITNVLGKVTTSNIVPVKYYILGDVSLTRLKLLAKDSVTITDKGIDFTLRLK